MTEPAVDRRRHGEAGVTEHAEHSAVVAKHVRVKAVDTLVPREACEALQQAGADAVALQFIRDRKRNLGAIGRLRIFVEASEGHDPSPDYSDQRGYRPV